MAEKPTERETQKPVTQGGRFKAIAACAYNCLLRTQLNKGERTCETVGARDKRQEAGQQHMQPNSNTNKNPK